MFAARRVQALVRHPQALDWLAADDMRLDDFINIGLGNESVPHRFRIDHKIRAVFALIETARLIRSHFALESALRQLLFKNFL